MEVSRVLHLALVFVLTTAPITASHAPQRIAESELQRFVDSGRFPVGCSEATLVSNQLRSSPTTDPSRLHDAANVFHACATGPYGANSDALHNQANFRASAALLLAARYEPPADSARDASAAKVLADRIAAYERPTGARTPRYDNYDPSPYRTDAGRIARDAAALISAAAPVTPV
jgi:hypothetical protein